MSGIFIKIYTFFKSHKILGFSFLLIFFALICFFASQIKLEEDVTRLIPSGERQNTMRRILRETNFSDKIIVTISSEGNIPNPNRLTEYAQRFIDSVNHKFPAYVNDIEGKIPEEGIMEIYDFVYDHLPLFLNNEDYNRITSRITEDSIENRLKDDYKNLISPTGLVTKNFIFKDPLSITSLGLKKLEELQVGEDFMLYNDFVITKDRKHVLLFIAPALPSSETDKNAIFIQGLRDIQHSLDKEYKGIKGDFFGGVLYSLANANRIKKDIQVTIGIAAAILLILLIVFYRRIYVPLLLFLPGVIGGISAIAALYFIEQSISAISIGIGAILLGITLDYGLHILTHYRNNRDIHKLYQEVTQPILMSSLTTATAFLCLLFVKSDALNDLGIFASLSVIVASVFALILVPLLYRVPEKEKQRVTLLDRLAERRFYKSNLLVGIIVFLFVSGLFFFTRVKFNNDISKLNYEPEQLKKTEEKMKGISGDVGKAIYLVSYGKTIDEALLRNNNLYGKLKELKKNGQIENFSSIGGVVLSTNTQDYKIEQWRDFWTKQKKEWLRQELIQKSERFGFRPASFNSFYNQLDKEFSNIYLDDYRRTTNLYLNDFISTSPGFATVTTTITLPKEKADAFVENFRNSEGIIAIDRKEMNQNFLGDLKDNFNRLILYSIIAVFLILLVFYRNFEISLLTILPIGITWVIALGIMGIFGIEFNILNIIISTFVFGLGLDYSIFITNASLKEYEYGEPVLPTYQTSILLSVITTLLGIGALVFAKHPALQSISLVSVIGITSALLVAFILQTRLFNYLFIGRSRRGLPPFKLSRPGRLFYRQSRMSNDKLYFKEAVLDNYRYKDVFVKLRHQFSVEKERYFKISNFLNPEDKVLEVYSCYGLLPIYLSYKNPEISILGIEKDEEKLKIAQECFRSRHENLNFTANIDSAGAKEADAFIISDFPDPEVENKLRELITRQAKKVIILNPDYPHRWILELNFEIYYRQNQMLMLQKVT